MNKVVFKSKVIYEPKKILMIIINRINHYFAEKNKKNFPQIATFSFDHISLRINLEGRYEIDSLNIINEFIIDYLKVNKKGIALDIGANIGNHAIFFSEIFDKVYAFEPNPKVFKLLEINSFDYNIIPKNFGISDVNCKQNFKINSNIGGSHIIKNMRGRKDSNIIQIDVKKLDGLRELSKETISLIKIDIEGHEINALNGGKKLILKSRPIILFEQTKNEISDKSSKVINLLRDWNYEFYIVEESYNFGENIFYKFLSELFKMIFGSRKVIKFTNNFKSINYDMIIASPKKLD